MNLEQIIAELKDEGEKIRLAIEALESLAGVKAKKLREYRDTPKTVQCPDCGKAFTFHGLTVHRAKHHGAKGAFTRTDKPKKRGTYTPRKAKYYENGRKVIASPTGKVRCIDCGQGPFDIGELDIHLKSCQAFALADRSNGNGSKR